MINNQIKKELPALLSKKKTVFISPAWKKNSSYIGDELAPSVKNGSIVRYKYLTIQPSAKKGEIEEVFWNKDSEYKLFCKHCGNAKHFRKKLQTDKTFGDILKRECPNYKATPEDYFNKNIGKVKLTRKEFQIQLFEEYHQNKKRFTVEVLGTISQWARSIRPSFKEKLAKGLGYKNSEEFFKEINKQFDLSKPKKFNVKIGEWIKC